MTRFGNVLKATRIAREMTLRKFALDNSWSAANLSRIERGLTRPSWRAAIELIRLYDCDPVAAIDQYLLDLRERMEQAALKRREGE